MPLEPDAAWVREITRAARSCGGTLRAFLRAVCATNMTPECSPSHELADYFEAVCRLRRRGKTVSNWVMGDLMSLLNEAGIDIARAR